MIEPTLQPGNGAERPAPKIGVYVCHCGLNIAAKVDVPAVVEFAKSLPFVTVAREYKFMCADPGQELIVQDLQAGRIDRVVVASCSPLMHELTFRRATAAGGGNPYLFQMANIREHVSWVTAEVPDATEKAKALIAGAVRRIVLHLPLERKRVAVHPDALVVGGGIAGIQCALTLADSGRKVFLVEREPTIGGHMAQFDKTFPTLDCSACILTPKMTQVRSHPNIDLMTYSEVEKVDGFVGNFTVTVRRKARFVREDVCTGCGECVAVCPVTLPSEFDEGLGIRKAIYRPFPQAVPGAYTITRRGMAPCQAACSIHQNAQGYVALVAQGKFREAMDVILRDNPLPGICGRICTHPCTGACTRSLVDEPLNIPGIKRFVSDTVGDFSLPRPETDRPERVAIVGSGPAGLMCAYELRLRGYHPVVFEALSTPGGMLAVGIPAFRMPRELLRAEIARLREIGIEIRLNTPIGKTLTLEGLRRQYAAVFVAVGAHVEKKMKIPGETLHGVFGGVEFLRKVNFGGPFPIGSKVLVIGGGNSALDAARTALRCGAEEVQIVYRRTRAEMPADPREVEGAEAEGVRFQFLVAPKAILGNGHAASLECIRMKLGPPDRSGRPAPEPIHGSEFRIACDAVIATIGQEPDLPSLGERPGTVTTKWNTLAVDPLTLETGATGVFAGGDCVTGPDVVVNAMFAGRKAAVSIDRFLNGRDLREGRELEGSYRTEYAIDTEGTPVARQTPMPTLAASERRINFAEVHTGYTAEMAMEEARRCLDCGLCCECHQCADVCEANAIDYSMRDEIRELKVGTIVLATGFKPFDARRIARYGYGVYPEVYTALQVERMVNASGPTGGEIRMRDGRAPAAVGIIHCVGSRDENTNRYCSRVCCMYSLKLAHLVRERTGADVYNFYIDMRTPGKGYEEFYDKLLSEGVHFIRGRVAEVSDWTVKPAERGRLVIRAEDTLIGVVRRIPVDMVVLAIGMEPQADAEEVRRKFNLSCSREGWFLERHPKLAPVSTFTDGVFIAGTCQGPKDIPDTVAQAGAAAGEALSLMDRSFVDLEPNTAFVQEELCSGCKTCIPMCPFTALTFDPVKAKVALNEALCKGCGTCVAACPSGALQQQMFTDEQIYQEIEGVLSYA